MTNGRATAISTRWRTMVARRRRCAARWRRTAASRWYASRAPVGKVASRPCESTAIMHPLSRRAHHEQREQHDDGHQGPGQGRGIADVALLERLVIDVQRKEERGPRGAADLARAAEAAGRRGDDERLGEVLEGIDEAQHQVKEDGGRNEGDGDVPETAERAGAVQRGGLVQLFG